MKTIIIIFTLVFQLLAQEILLSEEEENLIGKGEFKIGLTETWPPFNFSKENKIEGISLDYWNLIKSKINLKSKVIKSENFSEVLKNIRLKKYDLTINTTYTKQRAKYAAFSKTYEFFPIGIVTKTGQDFISKTSLLNGKKVAVGKEYSAYYLLKKKHPSLDFILVRNTEEALKLVEQGSAYAAVDILPSLQYHISKISNNHLIINGISDLKFHLQIMVKKDLEELIPIIDRAIDSITEEERNKIYAKWLLNPNKQEIDYSFIYQIGLIMIILILIFIYWNIKLQKARDLIAKERNKLNEILSKLPVPILIVDNKTKKILFANQFATVLYRTTFEDLLGKAISVLYTTNSQREDILKATDERGILINFETSFKLMDGNVIDGLLSFIPLNYEGRACRMGVVTDITELKSTQKELKLLNEDLEEKINLAIDKNKEQQMFLFQQSRLAQMGEMISMIAHQWRQPLNVLSLIIQTLRINYEKEKLTTELVDELVDDSTSQIKLMNRTIEDFMSFFKPDKKIELFDTNDQIKTSLDLLSKLLVDKGIEIEINLCDDPEVVGYPNEFGQVIINLIVNAKDAILDNNIPNGKIKIESEIKNDKVIIKIVDNAKGVDESVIEKIFDPYFSTKLKKNGGGLGLYMSKLIIEGHMKGKIYVENFEDGACFKIELKIYKDKN